MRLILGLVLASSLFAADEAKEAVSIPDGVVIPQIAAGGAWSTDIQVMHADTRDIPLAFTVRFFDDFGSPLALPVVGVGMTAGVTGVVAARSSRLIEISGGQNTLSGYAVLDAPGAVTAMNAVLTQKVQGRPDFQASIPALSVLQRDIQFPFRNDGPYTTTVAAVGGSNQTITAVARDESGNAMCSITYASPANSHAGNLLTDLLPCTEGQRGAVQVTASGTGGALIAFLFNDSGAFTTQIPYEITGR